MKTLNGFYFITFGEKIHSILVSMKERHQRESVKVDDNCLLNNLYTIELRDYQALRFFVSSKFVESIILVIKFRAFFPNCFEECQIRKI